MQNEHTHKMYYSKDKNNFKLIAKDDFWMEYINIPYVIRNSVYHYHDCYELYYLLSGERYYFIEDKTYHVKSGNFVLINSYDIHGTTSFENYGFERILINFKKDFIKELTDVLGDINLFENLENGIHVVRLNFQEQHYAETLLKQMVKEYDEKKAGYEAYLKSSMILLLILLSRQSNEDNEVKIEYYSKNHKNISEITGYINNNYAEDITLDSVCKQFFISPYYFSRTFKKNTGFTFVEYLNGVRIKEAQKLLLETNLSVTEISNRVGYKSITHFGRVFKNITGSAPLHYRKIKKDES